MCVMAAYFQHIINTPFVSLNVLNITIITLIMHLIILFIIDNSFLYLYVFLLLCKLSSSIILQFFHNTYSNIKKTTSFKIFIKYCL